VQKQATPPLAATTFFFTSFSVDCSVPFCRKEEAAAIMDEPSQSEDRKLSAMEHVKKRHEEKGFLYAWSVSLPQATRS